MKFGRFVFPVNSGVCEKGFYEKIYSQYHNFNLKERLLTYKDPGIKETKLMLLGQAIQNSSNDSKIYFHPAKLGSSIDATKTYSIFLGTKKYSVSGSAAQIDVLALFYNDGTKDYSIFALEFNSDPRLDLVPLYTIDKNGMLYISFLYLQGMLKYYVKSIDGGLFSLFENDAKIKADLPLFYNELSGLEVGEKNVPEIVKQKQLEWYGLNSLMPDNAFKQSVEFLVGCVDQNTDNYSLGHIAADDGGEFIAQATYVSATEIKIDISPRATPSTITLSFSFQGTNLKQYANEIYCPDDMFFYAKIDVSTGGAITGIKINTIVDSIIAAKFVELIKRIDFFNMAIKYLRE